MEGRVIIRQLEKEREKGDEPYLWGSQGVGPELCQWLADTLRYMQAATSQDRSGSQHTRAV